MRPCCSVACFPHRGRYDETLQAVYRLAPECAFLVPSLVFAERQRPASSVAAGAKRVELTRPSGSANRVERCRSRSDRLIALARTSQGKSDVATCTLCRATVSSGTELCLYHLGTEANDWAATNRIMCDFFHRKKLPPRLAPEQRDEEVMSYAS
jgi:hypothetical protein